MTQTARFTDKFLAILINQVRSFSGAAEELNAIQGEGMTVQRILSNGRVNVTFGGSFRTFSPKDLVIA